jgi:hypothetical protein
MSAQAKTIVRRPTGRRRLKALFYLILGALTGCFGPPTMHYDIQKYNKEVLSSEEEMLLYNIGELHYGQPPHFMMLSSIAQTRMFSASAGFQWTNLWNSLFFVPATTASGPTVSTQGSNTWQAGPFTAGATENPTFQFVPVQGNDFAQRLESSLTDKFTLFLEDRSWYSTTAETEELVMMFAQSLNLSHGDSRQCGSGLYVNKIFDKQEKAEAKRKQVSNEKLSLYDKAVLAGRDYSKLWECVKEISNTSPLYYEMIDANHPVPTKASEDPKAADLVTALQAGYKWTKIGDKYVLVNPVKIPAWFDYEPVIAPAPKSKQPESSTPVLWIENRPPWQGLQYTLPKGYQWKAYKDDRNSNKYIYALVPDGYDLAREKNGDFKRDNDGNPVLAEVKPDEPDENVRLSYGDEIASDVWPVPQNYFYLELRKGANDITAEQECHGSQPFNPTGDLVCGYFKVGNLLQIMQRLADTACSDPYDDEDAIAAHCSQSIFGIGTSVPPWAENVAPYKHLTGPYKIQTESIWVPAHNPRTELDLVKKDPAHEDLAARDRVAFFTLYKLYQTALVDTSKLVTGTIPITISK